MVHLDLLNRPKFENVVVQIAMDHSNVRTLHPPRLGRKRGESLQKMRRKQEGIFRIETNYHCRTQGNDEKI
jgi:hypothetical protein